MSTTVIVTFRAKPGRGPELVAWLAQNQASLPSFSGFESISLEHDPLEPERVIEIERWAAADDHRRMLEQVGARDGWRRLDDLLAEDPQTLYLETAAALVRPRGAASSRWEVPIRGGCACGAIRYACAEAPLLAVNCYCRDCQHASGGACSTGLAFRVAAVAIEGRAPKRHVGTAASGNEVWRAFCSECGSPLFAGNSANKEIMAVKIGSLDDPSLCAPAAEIWTKSAPAWAPLDPALPSFPENPPSRAP